MFIIAEEDRSQVKRHLSPNTPKKEGVIDFYGRIGSPVITRQNHVIATVEMEYFLQLSPSALSGVFGVSGVKSYDVVFRRPSNEQKALAEAARG